jgi:hypothetical protein
VPLPFQTTQKHLQDNQFHALSGEHAKTHPYTESASRENAFGILLQQHVHFHRKIHTRNACHNIRREKTQLHCYDTLQLTVTLITVEYDVTAGVRLAWLSPQGRTCVVHGSRITLNGYSTWNRKKTTFLFRNYLRNRSTSDMGNADYIDVI